MDNLDFLNLNTRRSYPLKEGVSRKSTDGLFTIPDEFMVDLMLCTSAAVEVRFYISEISNIPEQITIKVSASSGVVAGTFIIDTATYKMYENIYFQPTSTYTGSTGKLVVGYTASLAKLPTGTFRFTLNTTEFEARTVIPSPLGLNRLIFRDDHEIEFSVTGDVSIYGRSNLKFRLAGEKVYMDAGNGLGLNKKCDNDTIPINTINTIGPDPTGNFTLGFSDCGEFRPIANGLILDDSCTRPCMGCNEVEELTERLMALESDLLKLRSYFDNLNATITQVHNVINFNCELP